MVGLEKLDDPEEIAEVRRMIERHVHYTKSGRGQKILSNWEAYLPKFVKVMPKDYKRMLSAIKTVSARGLSGEDALMAAFEENSKDMARVGGN